MGALRVLARRGAARGLQVRGHSLLTWSMRGAGREGAGDDAEEVRLGRLLAAVEELLGEGLL
jgi:hypothetical protein